MDIHWYPGHMAKTRRIIKENLRLVDVVLEIVDARAPKSTHIPDIHDLIGSKKLLIIMNKADLADEKTTERWVSFFADNGMDSLSVDSRRRVGFKKLNEFAKELSGKIKRPLRGIVVGVPNVGKSSFINQIAGRKGAKTGNKPGITRGKMWLKAGDKFELLDTPGILWPKIEEEAVGLKLAFLGCIKEELLNVEEISLKLIGFLMRRFPETLVNRYGVNSSENPPVILEQIAKNRGFMAAGGKADTFRAAKTLLKEFQEGKLGRISLEEPGEEGGLWQDL
ncbi:ribosome biogenesis GTPase YlqF [Thermosediminibacter oceani]|uniref:Ribosome biogenesis GTPase A n=1 Tax=Thermosediminibacter oceani (strain ATCC BAA-1034 / DSM 16646 / JW/IW-1228P) TaxID=555079 RepID=D9S356_THEOJ|nr:ribosome biogenesis GTPase YlqF [Thermosediminibacter oceani]ADL07833.1 ribosome biogenesis GTP-binding protein YlqF [Thermosediminibacter oceani DSM 16646]